MRWCPWCGQRPPLLVITYRPARRPDGVAIPTCVVCNGRQPELDRPAPIPADVYEETA